MPIVHIPISQTEKPLPEYQRDETKVKDLMALTSAKVQKIKLMAGNVPESEFIRIIGPSEKITELSKLDVKNTFARPYYDVDKRILGEGAHLFKEDRESDAATLLAQKGQFMVEHRLVRYSTKDLNLAGQPVNYFYLETHSYQDRIDEQDKKTRHDFVIAVPVEPNAAIVTKLAENPSLVLDDKNYYDWVDVKVDTDENFGTVFAQYQQTKV